jgi:hypothetical protein
MHIIRAINVLTLACLLVLTGCFGIADDTISPEAEGQTPTAATVPNHAPSIDVFQYTQSGIEEYWVMDPLTNTSSVIGANVSLYHAAIDLDGDLANMGWDLDLDGTIDHNVTNHSGFSFVFIPASEWHAYPSSQMTSSILRQMTSIAFIAADSSGNTVSQFLHINSPPFTPGYVFGFPQMYQFGAEDANGDTTAGTEDNLVRVTMSQGVDLNWASISVKISVNNGAPVTCDNPGAAGGSCGLVEFGSTTDQVWSAGDGVTIVESGQDLCTAGETCEIKVTITDTREGKTLDESTSFAE